MTNMEHIIPRPRFPLGAVVYDHWPEQYRECWGIKYVVVGVRWDWRTRKLDYTLAPYDEVTELPRMGPELTDGYNEEHIDNVPRDGAPVSKSRPEKSE